MLQNVLQSRGVRQILGAGVGMLIAVGIYGVIQMLPSSAINRGLLINPTSLLQKNVGEVSVNNKNIDSEELKRLQAKAQQVEAALKNGNTSDAGVPETGVRTDRAAWIAMRAAVREKNAVHDLAPYAAAEAEATPIERDTTTVADAMTILPDEPQIEPVKDLPDSGLGLNLILTISVLGALAMIASGKVMRQAA